MSNLDELAAALNTQVTDDQGEVVEETTQEESAPQEQTTVEEDATAEKSAESEEASPEESKESENEPEMVETASDETGKRYVPETRFKEVYGKMKDLERKLKEPKTTEFVPRPSPKTPIDRADLIETELLRATLPQFNPESPEYSRELDEVAYDIWRNPDNKGITKLEAGRRAIEKAKKLASKTIKITEEARTVKAQQSDQGITSRVTSRGATDDTPGEDASPEDIEKWLKAKGEW